MWKKRSPRSNYKNIGYNNIIYNYKTYKRIQSPNGQKLAWFYFRFNHGFDPGAVIIDYNSISVEDNLPQLGHLHKHSISKFNKHSEAHFGLDYIIGRLESIDLSLISRLRGPSVARARNLYEIFLWQKA